MRPVPAPRAEEDHVEEGRAEEDVRVGEDVRAEEDRVEAGRAEEDVRVGEDGGSERTHKLTTP